MIFTTVNDAVRYVDSIYQDDQSRDGETHSQVIRRVGQQVWDEGHEHGLRSGHDWSAWLNGIEGHQFDDFVDGTADRIAGEESTTLTEIESILQSAGPMFDGGTDADRARISREWDEDFEPAAVRLWVAAGCWQPSTAVDLDDAGFSVTRDKLRFTDGRTGDAMHELCDGNVTIDDVTW